VEAGQENCQRIKGELALGGAITELRTRILVCAEGGEKRFPCPDYPGYDAAEAATSI
jgi:hypothetical protein